MWFPAPGKLAVNGAFGNVGVPPIRLSYGLISRRVSPESGFTVGHRTLRGGPQLDHAGSRREDFP
ncbi:hypothetical protein Aab01nite_27810 [Paractinoplanes abujensis]|nr:hypothetical protein Aab01nite_27810 [Actinoplanes abujensis]